MPDACQPCSLAAAHPLTLAAPRWQVRVIKVDEGKRQIGLSMKEWVAPEDRPQRKPRGDSGGGDSDDKEFQLSAEELEGLQAPRSPPASTYTTPHATPSLAPSSSTHRLPPPHHPVMPPWLSTQGGDDDFESSFDAAFARMTLEQELKKEKKKFARQML